MKSFLIIMAIMLALAVIWTVTDIKDRLHPFGNPAEPGRIGDQAKAEQLLDQIVDEPLLVGRHHPARAAWWPYYRGLLAETAGMKGTAITFYSKALDADPRAAGLYFKRGNLYGAIGYFLLALSDYSHAVNCDPGYAKAYFNRGMLYWTMSDYDHPQAVEDVTKAAALKMSDAKIWLEAH
jgi:tetratricopeptide (TPR) repeat protein